MNSKYASIQVLKDEFDFLIKDYSFRVINEKQSNMESSVELSNDKIRIHLFFDFRDYFFYFSIIRGVETSFPNDGDDRNIKTFWDLAVRNSFETEKLIPEKENGYKNALKYNVDLLKNYGHDILIGKEWI